MPEAVPISLDEGVETIGEAYVEEEGHEVAERKLGTSRLLGGRVTDAYQTEHVVLWKGTWARQKQQQKAEKLMPDKEPPSSEGTAWCLVLDLKGDAS